MVLVKQSQMQTVRQTAVSCQAALSRRLVVRSVDSSTDQDSTWLTRKSAPNLYAAVTHEMDNGVTVRGELGFVKNEVLDNPQSPSYPNLSFPTIFPGQAG
jgi:hypothetical protein